MGTTAALLTDDVVDSGHPLLHPDGRSLITDAYPWESMAFDDGTVPIRFVDIKSGTERNVLRIPTTPVYMGGGDKRMRVDPHPAWRPDYRFVVFNTCPNGHRKVYIAGFDHLVGATAL
ncbi:hypothetical protein [Halocatena marina]|uniref:Uncharacterized protein n=1 Tax=Halocatena marina TaxID=2934937 RepID=A0ABD5YUE0_9EURY|nr:hypothetical protein [Halocatena marina]